MPDLSLIAGTVSSLKAASDIAKALVGIRDATMLNEKVIELQRVILAAQSDAFAAQSEIFSMHEKVRELEKRLADVVGWEAEKARYQMVELYKGAIAYSLRDEARINGEPHHYICASCYQKGRKTILQGSSGSWGAKLLTCHECKIEITHSWE